MRKKQIVGWREWVSLPDLGLAWVKAKVDTGARTSALHAFSLEEFRRDSKQWVRFVMHPLQKCQVPEFICEAIVKDVRDVTDSGGHCEKRYVIETSLCLGERTWPIEMTLTNRETMKFRMLLGRTAMANRLVVDPELSYCFNRPTIEDLSTVYTLRS